MANNNDYRMVFRCFGYPGTNGSQKGYFAACLDLGIVTFRPTLDDAKQSLNEAIDGRVKTANEIADNEKEFIDLVCKPLPFWPWRARYFVISILFALSKSQNPPQEILFDSSVIVPGTA